MPTVASSDGVPPAGLAVVGDVGARLQDPADDGAEVVAPERGLAEPGRDAPQLGHADPRPHGAGRGGRLEVQQLAAQPVVAVGRAPHRGLEQLVDLGRVGDTVVGRAGRAGVGQRDAGELAGAHLVGRDERLVGQDGVLDRGGVGAVDLTRVDAGGRAVGARRQCRVARAQHPVVDHDLAGDLVGRSGAGRGQVAEQDVEGLVGEHERRAGHADVEHEGRVRRDPGDAGGGQGHLHGGHGRVEPHLQRGEHERLEDPVTEAEAATRPDDHVVGGLVGRGGAGRGGGRHRWSSWVEGGPVAGPPPSPPGGGASRHPEAPWAEPGCCHVEVGDPRECSRTVVS